MNRLRNLILIVAYPIGIASGLMLASACVSTPSGLKIDPVAAHAMETGIADACQLESALPDGLGFLSMLCPVEVAAADALINAETAQPVDAGPPVMASTVRRVMLRVRVKVRGAGPSSRDAGAEGGAR